MQTDRHLLVHSGIGQKPAIELTKPARHNTRIGAPQNIAAAVPVEIANAHHMQAERNINENSTLVRHKTAVRLAKPIGQRAKLVPPQNVAPTITVEIIADVTSKHQLDTAARG